MPHNTYIAETDQKFRAMDLVYTQDLALSGVLLALRSSARSPMLAALNLNFLYDALPDFSRHEEFHEDLSGRVSRAARRILTPKGTDIESEAFPDVKVAKAFSSVVEVSVDYWEVAPLKVCFVATRKAIDRDSLTGFIGFNPVGYDEEARKGKAQDVIDTLREQSSL